ncbi:MAG: hypothetical protein WCV67_20470, partial [Victivallaceae bacterium]
TDLLVYSYYGALLWVLGFRNILLRTKELHFHLFYFVRTDVVENVKNVEFVTCDLTDFNVDYPAMENTPVNLLQH